MSTKFRSRGRTVRGACREVRKDYDGSFGFGTEFDARDQLGEGCFWAVYYPANEGKPAELCIAAHEGLKISVRGKDA